MESYYELLGVSRDASTHEIETAYRERAKQTHPDRSDAPDAAEQFKRVALARDVLTSPRERARYDRLGHAAYLGEGPSDSRTATSPREGASSATRDHDQRAARTGATTDRRTRADGVGGWANWGGDEHDEQFTREHAAENRSRSWYRSGADGDDGYRVSTRDDRGVRFTTERIGLAVVTFALYPLLVGSTFLPVVPAVVSGFVGLCTIALVVYLLSVPETGVLVFGGWTILAPFALTIAGVGLLSGLGILAWAFCWVPFAIAFANLLFSRA
ncbi:J domain-containing protein [Halorarius litoreus]|uniref:J domain-containing protein n=1 Tax=Halorarius litoreus TaxID=2962676 RepID=UPI0020CBA07D|nr:DnaJ domain-containing protein [Halorarius litoreus]